MIDNLFKITALIVGTSSTIQSNYIDILELIAMIKFNTYFFFFFFYIYNLRFFEQKTYSHQELIYLNVPGISVRKPLKNRQIVSQRTTGCVSVGVVCASLLTGRHLLMNKKNKNSRYTNIKIMII